MDPILAKIEGKTGYIRLGTWNPSEQSRCYATGDIEYGVSAFGAVWIPQLNKWDIIVFPYADNIEKQRDRHGDLADTAAGLLKEFRKEQRNVRELTGYDPEQDIFLVAGRWIGWGWDGDPLLKGVKMVERLTLDMVMCSDVGIK